MTQLCNYSAQAIKRPFISSWKTDNAGTSSSTQITIPVITSTGIYDGSTTVDWGDGNISTGMSTSGDARWTHTYSGAGTYTVKIYGTFSGIRFNNGGDRLKLLGISQWGSDFRVGIAQGQYFYGCSNLVITANDTLNLTGTTSLAALFRACAAIVTVPNINLWNTSKITDLTNTFTSCSLFNQALSFDTSAVTTFNSFLSNCTVFNSAVTLNTAAATNFGSFFINCVAFNQSLASFVTTAGTNFGSFLAGCTVFNQSVSTITTASATTLASMFLNCAALNQSVTHFVTTICTSFAQTFNGCTLMNPDVSGWSIAALTNANLMFNASGFAKVNYNKLLDNTTGWASQATINNGVLFSAGTAHYDGAAAIAGRAVLATTHTWTMTDGGTP